MVDCRLLRRTLTAARTTIEERLMKREYSHRMGFSESPPLVEFAIVARAEMLLVLVSLCALGLWSPMVSDLDRC